jgi:hypothetical protein
MESDADRNTGRSDYYCYLLSFRDTCMEGHSRMQDGMLVCRNGHVITDLLQSYPDLAAAHCDRCGATTLDRCPTCGQHFLGATLVPGMTTLGSISPPHSCHFCGAPFPWSDQPGRPAAADPFSGLENFLRRLPKTICQLRSRHADRPPLRVHDEHDLEDVLRAVLPLQFAEVRPECRTPRYASCTRMDFRLGEGQGSAPWALTAKLMARGTLEGKLRDQWAEDIAYYEAAGGCQTLVAFIYDPEGIIREQRKKEVAWSKGSDALVLRCIIVT